MNRASFLPALVFLSLVMSNPVVARTGEVRHVVPFHKTKIVTDPKVGTNSYRQWGAFPSKSTATRRVVLSVTYQCPDSLHCGEWDYIDNVVMGRAGGTGGTSKDLEIARLISPYGWRFDSVWHFTWHCDISDFAAMLHDSVEIVFNHSGYESNTDRGWLVTLDFAVTEGRAPMEFLGVDTLWHGTIPYGDTLKSFDERVPPRRISNTLNAQTARIRILQTGHGMDNLENCAEFCNKYRQVFFDDSLLDTRQIWRKCGANPLYPQGGTWIYDRANWCPGSIVFPDVYDVPIAPSSIHTVRISMQPYLNRKNPTANYCLSSYVFYYKAPWAANDVGLDEIIAPSQMDEYSRMNPICDNPRIVIRNNGKNPLTSVVVRYGFSGGEQQSYRWEGKLESQKTVEVMLPAVLAPDAGKKQFFVRLEMPNGHDDEFSEDNSDSSGVTVPPTYGGPVVVALRTNKDSMSIGYQVINQEGAIVYGHKIGAYHANTLYRDTLRLNDGCYQLSVTDTLGDGLDFWANPEGGFGFVRLLDLNGHLLKSFGSDFGSEINHSFTVINGYVPKPDTAELPIVNLFPIRNPGTFSLEIFLDNPQPDTKIAITTEDGKQIVFTKSFDGVKETIVPIDISGQPDGFYYLKLTAGGKTVSKKFKVKHKG